VALTALDTSVLIALLNPGDVHHQAARASLDPARAGKERAARRLIASLEIAVDPVNEAVAIAAARLRAQHGGALRMPDALVLAYADVCKAKRVLTADARWTAWSRRVELVGI
jgi:predicted nucleic acid-binding protein